MTSFQRTRILQAYRHLMEAGATVDEALDDIACAYCLDIDTVRNVVALLYPEPTQEIA